MDDMKSLMIHLKYHTMHVDASNDTDELLLTLLRTCAHAVQPQRFRALVLIAHYTDAITALEQRTPVHSTPSELMQGSTKILMNAMCSVQSGLDS